MTTCQQFYFKSSVLIFLRAQNTESTCNSISIVHTHIDSQNHGCSPKNCGRGLDSHGGEVSTECEHIFMHYKAIITSTDSFRGFELGKPPPNTPMVITKVVNILIGQEDQNDGHYWRVSLKWSKI